MADLKAENAGIADDREPDELVDGDDTDLPENGIDTAAANRLRDAVAAVGGPAKVARSTGIPVGTISRYMRGKRDMRRAAMVALAKACGVSLAWLATGHEEVQGFARATLGGLKGSVTLYAGPVGPQPGDVEAQNEAPALDVKAQNEAPTGYVAIPRYNIAASAGGGALAEHPQVVEYIAYAEDYLRQNLHRRAQDLGLVEARGDSMQPTLHDGDILTVDVSPNQTLRNGLLYVLAIGDDLLVKRIELRLNSIVLHSDNLRYAPETIDRAAAEQLQIIGQVLLTTAPPR